MTSIIKTESSPGAKVLIVMDYDTKADVSEALRLLAHAALEAYVASRADEMNPTEEEIDRRIQRGQTLTAIRGGQEICDADHTHLLTLKDPTRCIRCGAEV